MPDAAGPGPAAAVAETHISWVFFAADRAYKLLKPIRTPFLDYSTPERRADACRREVALNSRLSPDVYLGVSPILERGEVADFLIVMRRLPASRRLSALAGTAGFSDRLREVARAVARFHASLAPHPDAGRVATAEHLEQLWTTENLEQMADRHPDGRPVHDPATTAEIRRLALGYLAGRSRLFEHRIAEGHVVDGHGDLLADDIFCMDDGPRILDCLAFDDDLRLGDVLADVAFLAMDLESLPGGAEGSATFLGTYDELTAEHHPRSLLHFYVAQRALVRAKVRGLRSLQGDDEGCRQAAADAERTLHQCLRHLRAATVHLVLVGGAPGTGKTTVATAVADVLGAAALSSDELRKDLAGVARTDRRGDRLDEGLYAPETTERTYRELLHRAAALLEMGESVVLDASWTSAAERDRARAVATACHAPLHELRCVLDPDLAAGRVARRLAATGPDAADDASDATPEIARVLAGRAEAWPEAVEVDTTDAIPATLSAALQALGLGSPRW